MEEIDHRIHWLSFTVHAPSETAMDFYKLLLCHQFGHVEPLGHGGRGFKEIFKTALGMKFYLSPINTKEVYWSCEIPGLACDVLGWEYFEAIGDYLISNYGDALNITRLDYAFDHVPFTPEQVRQAIMEGQVRSLAKRETLHIDESPFAKKDNGDIGTCTVSFGSRTSERMIRVYNKRGFTRLEFETKDLRANLIFRQLCTAINPEVSFYTVLAHLLDYVAFYPSWWGEFANSTNRAGATVSNPREITLEKTIRWMEKQVSPALSALVDVLPMETIDLMVKRGRARRGEKYNLILGEYE